MESMIEDLEKISEGEGDNSSFVKWETWIGCYFPRAIFLIILWNGNQDEG